MTNPSDFKKSRRPALKIPKEVKNAAQQIGKGVHLLWKRPLFITIILIILAGILLNLVVTKAFKPYFNCAYMIGKSLNTDALCQGYSFNLDLGFSKVTIPILPALKTLDQPLEALRLFISWDIIIFFALLSLVLAFIVNKIGGFVKYVMTEEGRKVVLTNVSIWLLFFVIMCSLFIFNVVR